MRVDDATMVRACDRIRIASFREARMRRPSVGGTVGAVFVAVTALSASVPSQALAAVPTTGFGGYVASPDALRTARLDLKVPALQCDAALGAYRVEVGLAGHQSTAGHVRAWSLLLRLECDAAGVLTTK